jgi:hypothetical protein
MTPVRFVALAVVLTTPALSPAQSYWLGRQPDPQTEEFVFDVPVPSDLAAKLTCADAKGAKFKSGVREFLWEIDGKTYRFFQNDVSWDDNRIDTGMFAHFRDEAVEPNAWVRVDPKAAGFRAVRDALVAQKKARDGGWFEASPILLRAEGKENPKLTVNFNADAPFSVTRHPPDFDSSIAAPGATKKPQIVAVVQGDTLFVAYQTWDRTKPTDKVVIAKVPLGAVAKQKLALVRVLPSGGVLVGFTVDEKGRDYALTAKAEEFPNNPKGDFVEKIANTWRKDVLVLHAEGAATDLNSDKFTATTFYGIGNAGSGRLVAGAGQLGAVFARRYYAPSDKLIHQEADVLLMASDLSKVPIKAHNAASHSFDQRLIFDGTDFVSLHQSDQYPVTGLIVEKMLVGPGKARRAEVRRAAFSCPTFGNAVFFELGGLAAEPDGYPVLFTATRNTGEVGPKAVEEKAKRPWDLAMLYVRRDFHTKTAPKNPFNVVGSGVHLRQPDVGPGRVVVHEAREPNGHAPGVLAHHVYGGQRAHAGERAEVGAARSGKIHRGVGGARVRGPRVGVPEDDGGPHHHHGRQGRQDDRDGQAGRTRREPAAAPR